MNMEINNREINNREKGKYCKGCAWRHIGVNVDHNHCDYNIEAYIAEWNEFEQRVNGHLVYVNGKLLNLSEQCRWFWDESNKEKPTKEGFYYKPPGGYQRCPKIPHITKRGK